MPGGQDIAKALGGRWNGKTGMARCPAHEDRTPSLSLREDHGKLLVSCQAGCVQADVISALKRLNLWTVGQKPGTTPQINHELTSDERARRAEAREIWEAASPIAGTLAEQYLLHRGIKRHLPTTLRFLPKLRHGPSRESYPALLGVVQDHRGYFLGIQRTWITPDGSRKAPVSPAKMSLGPLERGSLQCGPAGEFLGLAEGLETALSAKQIYAVPVWATLSAHRLHSIKVPDVVETVIIFGDRGRVGWDCAKRAADEYERQGFHTEIQMPPAGRGDDFNTWLQAGMLA